MLWNELETAGWGRALRARERVARPERAAALAGILAQTPCPAIGNRRSYGDAALNGGGGASLRMTRLDRLLAFDPGTGLLEVEAGATLGEIARLFAPRGWLPAVMPGTGFATVGGCIANDVHGKNHHEAGSFGQHVTAIELLGPDGAAHRVTPESAPELFRATAGGLGQTGAILSATIRMLPCDSATMRVRERRAEGLEEFLDLFAQSTAPYTVGWIDATATGARLGRGIFEEGRIATHAAQHRRGRARAVPVDAPGALLSRPVVRLFNELYYRRVPAGGRSVTRPFAAFFFPLDAIHDWNRLYGRRGFHQFQCVLPDDAAEVLRGMLARIGGSGTASPLAVLKRMGPGRAGYLSFPMEGWTLAVDFPNRRGAADLVRELTAMTADAGGRIYMAKDSLATSDEVAAMYPERAAFARAAAEADPARALETDLVRRLKLRDPE
jgi:decaprenylphospho-beta-D-ribofuranose 2-oxidase